MANFVSNDNATSLMNAINQKKDSKPGTITWAEWIALTDEQREGTHYIITNVPAKFSDKDAVFSIKDQTLTFTNKVATVSDTRITSDTYIFTFYHNQAVAQAAGIECSWTTGTVTFTVVDTPASDIVVDILCILPALATPPSEGGGHVIEDASGTGLPQEDTLQFADARVEDDSTNGKTVVHVTQEPMTVSDFNAAADLNPGIYPLNGGEVLDDSMIAHDTNTTVRQAIEYRLPKVLRQKNLGTFTTTAQLESFLSACGVSTGKFDGDIQIGDYVTIAGYKCIVAGFDTEYNKGDTALQTHHITFIANFGNSRMNETNTTAGGYEGASTMQTFLSSKETELNAICGSHLLSRRCLTTNAVTDGKSSNWAWTDHKLTLMSETQIYGGIQWGNVYDTGEGYEKLPIFNYLTPLQVFGRTYVWLRGVYSATYFCISGSDGGPGSYDASVSLAAGALFCIS